MSSHKRKFATSACFWMMQRCARHIFDLWSPLTSPLQQNENNPLCISAENGHTDKVLARLSTPKTRYSIPLHCYIITYPLPQRDFVLLCPGPCSTLHLNVLKRNSDLHKDIKGGGDEREFIGPLLSADGCARAHTHTPALTPCDCESSLRVLPRIVYQIGY